LAQLVKLACKRRGISLLDYTCKKASTTAYL
jgi:hypothetical protein